MNLLDYIRELGERPTCQHNLNGPCGTCGLPPHETRIPEEMLWPPGSEPWDPEAWLRDDDTGGAA